MDKLSNYLKDALRARNWTQGDLARRVPASRQAVSNWVSDDDFVRVTPSVESCLKIAAALNEEPDTILVLAGWREPSPFAREEDPAVVRLMQAVRSLPKDRIEDVADFAEYQKQRSLNSFVKHNANGLLQELVAVGASR